MVGRGEGACVGCAGVGWYVGSLLGARVVPEVGTVVGRPVGVVEGGPRGDAEGSLLGYWLGPVLGAAVGATDGMAVNWLVGATLQSLQVKRHTCRQESVSQRPLFLEKTQCAGSSRSTSL